MIVLNLFHVFIIVVLVVISFVLFVKFTPVKFVIDPMATKRIRENIMAEITEDIRQDIFNASLPDVKDDVKNYLSETNQDLLNRLKLLIDDDLYLQVLDQLSKPSVQNNKPVSNKSNFKKFDIDNSIDMLK